MALRGTKYFKESPACCFVWYANNNLKQQWEEWCGGFALGPQGIAQQCQLARWNRLGERHGHASLHELRFHHHLRDHGNSKSRRHHRGDGDELGTLQNQFRFQVVSREQLTNLNRERMLFVQEQKLLRRQLAPPDVLPAREPMFLR